jgi:phosphoribosylanthranilate isomerase
MLWIKICGIQSLREAQWAVEAGAHALGFIFVHHSRRYIDPEKVQAIAAQLPPTIQKVGVFVNEDPEAVAEIVKQCPLDLIQLHGEETLQSYYDIPIPKLKAISFPVQDQLLNSAEFSANQLPADSPHSLQGILLDSNFQGQKGGTGTPLPWQNSGFQNFLHRVKASGYPIILAGGLNPDNVQKAIRLTQPQGIDVSSGVELAGRKNKDLIRAFIANASAMTNAKI